MSGAADQKVAVVAGTRLLCDCPPVQASPAVWGSLLQALLKLLEGKAEGMFPSLKVRVRG